MSATVILLNNSLILFWNLNNIYLMFFFQKNYNLKVQKFYTKWDKI